jgi:hypothetical protein
VGGRVERPDQADGLVLAAVRGAGGDVRGQEAAMPKRRDVSRERARERTPCRLHVANSELGPGLRRGPGRRRQVAVQRQDQDGRAGGFECLVVAPDRLA